MMIPWRSRPFSPGFVVGVEGFYVFVDHRQPVAVSVSPTGDAVDVHSWADSIEPPTTSTWPNRQIWHGATGLFVQDLPRGATVEVTANVDGGLSHRVVDSRDEAVDGRRVQRRLWRAAGLGAPVSGWTFESNLDGVAWSSTIRCANGPSRIDLGPPASILDFQVLDEFHASACIQRHDKRPWPFRPTIEMHVLRVEPSSGFSHVIVSDIDVADLCRPRAELNADRRYANREELTSYLSYSLGQHAELYRLGITRVHTAVHGDPDSGDAVILTFFSLDGVEYCRVDRPFDEFGNLSGGLRDMNVSLVEDVRSGNVPPDIRRGEVNYI